MFGHAGDYSAVRASDNIEETTVIGSTTTSVKGVAEEPTRQRQTWGAYACFVRKVNGFRDLNALRDDLMELKPTLFAGVPRVFEKAYEGKALNKKKKIYFLWIIMPCSCQSKVTFDGLVTCTMFIQTRFHAKDEGDNKSKQVLEEIYKVCIIGNLITNSSR
ncbi:Long chain acyl-CoA synthetase 1 [Glycine soja]